MLNVSNEQQALFDQAQHIVFLTGAGVSTASGIPDYRSKGGIYDDSKVVERPEYLLSTDALRDEPLKMYQFMKENMYFPDAKPNIIHQKMAALAQAGRAKIITQNVDSLHRLPADQLIEFHGSLYNIYAVIDHQPASVEDYLESPYREDGVLLRPGITLYGEIPFRTDEAISWMAQADLIVIVGTSFVVYPFAGLLDYAQVGTPIMSVNLTTIDAPSHVMQITGDATQFFNDLTV